MKLTTRRERLIKKQRYGSINQRPRYYDSYNKKRKRIRIICIVCAFLAAIAAALLLIPTTRAWLGLDNQAAQNANSVDVDAAMQTPTLPPQPKETDFSYLAQELLLTHGHLTPPCFYGDELLFSAAVNKDGDPILSTLFIYNMRTREETTVYGVQPEYKHLLETYMNDQFIVFLDAADQGGRIKCVDRETGDIQTVRDVALGAPRLRLNGSLLCWVERTGQRQDKLFVCDLSTMETVTLDTFLEDEHGMSAPGLSDTEIIYAKSDGQVGTSALIRYDLTAEAPESQIIQSGIYVHDPQTYGNTRAWLDGNNSPDATLYVSIDGGDKIAVETGISDFALGQGFVAYNKDEAVWVYRFDEELYARLSDSMEKSMLAGVSEDRVIWFDVSDIMSEQTVVKYARIEKRIGE